MEREGILLGEGGGMQVGAPIVLGSIVGCGGIVRGGEGVLV